jgi:hypothetical protein
MQKNDYYTTKYATDNDIVSRAKGREVDLGTLQSQVFIMKTRLSIAPHDDRNDLVEFPYRHLVLGDTGEL